MSTDIGGDNFRFDITGAPLDQALAIATSRHRTVAGWKIDDEATPTRLVLFWTESEANPLPAPMGGDALVAFVAGWLAAAKYGPEPRHDGINGRGSRVYNEAWGHIGQRWEAFIAIEPAWLMYGK